jgi:16S rRNA (adenine1518-N6/adenine1519-N6)-dimethyltransferase
MAPRFDELHVAPEPFIAFLRAGFAQKRKMLAKNLRNAGYTSEKIAAALASSNVNPKSRAEELDLPTMATFFRNLQP